MTTVYLVATDLDGSLLDHHDYSYAAALPVLDTLEQMRIPVVLASSKTRAEMLELRQEMHNEHPFIVENGAAVLIPQNYFVEPPVGCTLRDGYWLRELAPPRDTWLATIDALRLEFPGAFENFANASVDEVVSMTGLSNTSARRAKDREYSEPVQWRGDASGLQNFLARLEAAGAHVLKGGRFYSVSGNCDKGQALCWLREQYALAAGHAAVYDLAVGDGDNDIPMLEAAHRALPIPAEGRPLPALRRQQGVIQTEGFGPHAWAQGVTLWLKELYGGALDGASE